MALGCFLGNFSVLQWPDPTDSIMSGYRFAMSGHSSLRSPSAIAIGLLWLIPPSRYTCFDGSCGNAL